MTSLGVVPYDGCMAKRSKKPRDTNSLAAAIVAQATDPDDQGDDPYEGKAAAGAKGGSVAASRMTPAERSERARKAAAARWSDES